MVCRTYWRHASLDHHLVRLGMRVTVQQADDQSLRKPGSLCSVNRIRQRGV